jgi:hypothetical protein
MHGNCFESLTRILVTDDKYVRVMAFAVRRAQLHARVIGTAWYSPSHKSRSRGDIQ